MFNLSKVVEDYNVIFVDLDNTLFNYSHAHKHALSFVLQKYEITNEEYNKAKRTIKIRDLSANHHKKELYFKVIAENKGFSLRTVLDISDDYDRVFNENLFADKSILNMIKTAKNNNKKIIGITNFYVIPQLIKLKTTGFIDLLDFLVTSEEFEIEKPHKKLLHRALKLAGNPDVKDVIMIGDSIVDDLGNFGIKYYPYNCSKLLISISGKSGAGKSTISSIVKEALNAEIIEGDGYHKYERSHPEWKNVTHYNPSANNLIQLGLDIKSIYQDIADINVPIYNHENGLFDTPEEISHNSVDVAIIDGLHSLYPEVTGDFVKIKIFIDNCHSDNQKIRRDTTKRNKSINEVKTSISKREEDYKKYISIQKQYSNFVVEICDDEFKILISDDLDIEQREYHGDYKDLNKTVYEIMEKIKDKRYE